MADEYMLADELATALNRERLFAGGPEWKSELLAALAADDAESFARLVDREDAHLLVDLELDVPILGRQDRTESLLAYCCFVGAFSCARVFAHACALADMKDWIAEAASELIVELPNLKSAQEVDWASRALAELSIGQAAGEARDLQKYLLPLPMLPRNSVAVAHSTLSLFASRKFCSMGGRRSTIRDAMAAVASGDDGAFRRALSALESYRQALDDDPTSILFMHYVEIQFFMGACVNCDRPGCLAALLDWLLLKFERDAGAEGAASTVLEALGGEFANPTIARSPEARAAIVQSISKFCDRGAERSADAVKAVCGDLAPALAEAATTATLISLSRCEKEAIAKTMRDSGLVPQRARASVRL